MIHVLACKLFRRVLVLQILIVLIVPACFLNCLAL